MRKSSFILIIFGTVFLIALFVYVCIEYNTKQIFVSRGRIIYVSYSFNQNQPWLFIVDGEGNRPQMLYPIIGTSPTWSPSGKFIAAGCGEDSSKICIMDANTIPNPRNFREIPESYTPKTVQEIELPDMCSKKTEEEVRANATLESFSISWDSDEKKLAIVCGSGGIAAAVCILPLEGPSSCWDEQNTRNVYHAVWSPVDDVLAISGENDISALDVRNPPTKIYLTDAQGKNKVRLADGWSPEWSPDGRQVAFITWGDGTYPGIAIVNRDGTNFRWLYQSPLLVNGENDPEIFLTFSCEQSRDCRLAWSPDGRYLALSGSRNGGNARLFRIDLQTGEIIVLVNPYPNTSYSDLDWGP